MIQILFSLQPPEASANVVPNNVSDLASGLSFNVCVCVLLARSTNFRLSIFLYHKTFKISDNVLSESL